MFRLKLRKFFVLSWLSVVGLSLTSGWVHAQKSEISVQKKSAESLPSISEDMVMPESMPSMPGGFTGEEKASALLPPAEATLTEGPRLGLSDCVQMALMNNREVRAKDYDIQIAEN
ncbi:MAG: hypothetical protein K8R69_09785, partial [Deltaproteobacteria bacterium]|nr:hypothetical protein [Deltaproteobacteria bacterium]